jgi:hypothetical protein
MTEPSAKLIEAFTRFQTATAVSASKIRGLILRPDEHRLPTGCDMPLTEMCDVFSRGLLGEVNKFLVNISHADAWLEVVQQYPPEEQHGLFWEFGEPAFELAIGRPYSLRNQLIFAAAHILYRAKLVKNHTPKPPELPDDRRIQANTLNPLSSGWSNFAEFEKHLNVLNSVALRAASNDLRHMVQHRFRVHLRRGLAMEFENKETSFVFKTIRPVDVIALVPVLYGEHETAVRVFHAFQELALECLK